MGLALERSSKNVDLRVPGVQRFFQRDAGSDKLYEVESKFTNARYLVPRIWPEYKDRS